MSNAIRDAMAAQEVFTRCGAYLRHDQNPKRPYPQLTSRLISDGFFNGEMVLEQPLITEWAVGHLMHHRALDRALERIVPALQPSKGLTSQSPAPLSRSRTDRRHITRVIGAAFGGITLAYSAANHAGAKTAYARKTGESKDDPLVIERGDFQEEEVVLLIEDTISTGNTVEKLKRAVLEVIPRAIFVPCVLALCNRSEKSHVGDFEIAALVTPSFKTWELGSNPYTRDGNELVPPLRPPKKRENWKLLTQPYPL